MLDELKKEVCAANLELPKYDLVTFTWGNASGIDREAGMMVIKPSGVSYESMTPEDMVAVSLKTGETMKGRWKPSSDTATHIALYKAFPHIGGVVHTHSRRATSFARPASVFRPMEQRTATTSTEKYPAPAEIAGQYELKTGNVIIETFQDKSQDEIPAILVHSHGPLPVETIRATPFIILQFWKNWHLWHSIRKQ